METPCSVCLWALLYLSAGTGCLAHSTKELPFAVFLQLRSISFIWTPFTSGEESLLMSAITKPNSKDFL